MESAGCASDAEQSAWAYSYSMTAECGPVKEEPEWGECGVSDAAAAEGLYADHEVKDELVFGPEEVQQQDIAFSMENAQCRMEEALCKPKSVGGAESTSECTHACPRDGHLCNRSPAHQYMLRSCFISLERLPTGDLHTSKLGAQKTIDEAPCKQQPVGGAGAAPESTHTRPGEGPRCDMSHEQLFQLRSCCVQLQPFSPGDLHTCETCLITFACKSSLKKHSSTHSTEGTYFKHEASDKQNVLKRHLVRHSAAHNVETGTEKQLKYASDGDRLVNTDETSYFDKISKSKRTDQSALATHTGEKQTLLRCDICLKIFTQKRNLVKHVKIKHIHSVSKTPKQSSVHNRVHSGEKSLIGLTYHKLRPTRDIGKMKFAVKQSLSKKKHTGKKLFSCNFCNKQFAFNSNFARHIVMHTGEKPYSCSVCNKQFARKSNFNEHQKTHTRSEKLYSCDMCKKKFAFKHYLTTHIRIHTGEKPFSCDVCKKMFVGSSNLARHKIIHAREKPHSCSVCNKQFTHKSSFNRHKETHTTRENLYSCDTCEKKFAHKQSLITHIRIHTGEKPFSCGVCKKQFAVSSRLARHKLIHTGEKPHSCSVCNKQFTRKSSVDIHKKKHTL